MRCFDSLSIERERRVGFFHNTTKGRLIIMKKNNKDRGGCRDVFHSYLVAGSRFSGKYDIPILKEEHSIPRKCICFSEALKEKRDFNQWVVFYEDDYQFERLWNAPRKYLKMLKRFEGVITPDFSLYYDMPLAMQIWNIYRSRALGVWLQKSGIKVIPNIRFGIEETFDVACEGVPRHNVIAVGSKGCVKRLNYRKKFEEGLEYVAKKLDPETIIVYGSPPKNINDIKKLGINVIIFNPEFIHIRKEVD